MDVNSVQASLRQIDDHDITQFLKYTLQYQAISRSIFAQRIINRAAEERQIRVSPEDIQGEADRQRLELRLERATDTLAWLQSQGIEAEDWELGIRAKILNQKLKEVLFETDLEKAFNQSRLDFDKVLLYQLIIPYAPLAQELFYQIEEEEISFYEAAHAYDMDEMRRYRCGYEGLLHRWNLPPVLATAIFSVPPGKLAGPVQTEQGYHLLLPEKFIPAQLTDEVRKELFERLFQEWLKGELTYWNCQ
jgi:parvulin-like peptidyl-prolyl isomerase